MKIYTTLKHFSDILELETFCSFRLLDISNIRGIGTYLLDNTENKLHYQSLDEIAKVPDSFLLDWDYKHICDLYDNKILARFNHGKPQWTMMDFKSMEPMIQVMMYGAKKYERDNWKKACPARLSLLDSLMRHYIKLVEGESIDPESGLPHIGHLMCNAMFYSYWEQKTNGQFEDFIDIDQPL